MAKHISADDVVALLKCDRGTLSNSADSYQPLLGMGWSGLCRRTPIPLMWRGINMSAKLNPS
jgi:hypothetical protein